MDTCGTGGDNKGSLIFQQQPQSFYLLLILKFLNMEIEV